MSLPLLYYFHMELNVAFVWKEIFLPPTWVSQIKMSLSYHGLRSYSDIRSLYIFSLHFSPLFLSSFSMQCCLHVIYHSSPSGASMQDHCMTTYLSLIVYCLVITLCTCQRSTVSGTQIKYTWFYHVAAFLSLIHHSLSYATCVKTSRLTLNGSSKFTIAESKSLWLFCRDVMIWRWPLRSPDLNMFDDEAFELSLYSCQRRVYLNVLFDHYH